MPRDLRANLSVATLLIFVTRTAAAAEPVDTFSSLKLRAPATTFSVVDSSSAWPAVAMMNASIDDARRGYLLRLPNQKQKPPWVAQEDTPRPSRRLGGVIFVVTIVGLLVVGMAVVGALMFSPRSNLT